MNAFFEIVADNYLWAAALAVVSFVQNMAFTASSRSRNSGNPSYHFRIAVVSNGIWFACHILVWSQIWGAVRVFQSGTDQIAAGLWLVVIGAVYITATSFGSSYMMSIMLRKEQGDRRVGAGQPNESPNFKCDFRGEGDYCNHLRNHTGQCSDEAYRHHRAEHTGAATGRVTSYSYSDDGLRLVCEKCGRKSHYPELQEEVDFIRCEKCGHIYNLRL